MGGRPRPGRREADVRGHGAVVVEGVEEDEAAGEGGWRDGRGGRSGQDRRRGRAQDGDGAEAVVVRGLFGAAHR